MARVCYSVQLHMSPSIPSRPRILLFDIDGTLLSADGAGRRALSQAFRDVTGVEEALAAIDFRGMTDRLIVEQALAQLAPIAATCEPEAIYALYVKHLERELAQSQGTRALPGALELMNALDWQSEAFAIGLGTGNLEPTAHLKLNRVGMAGLFSFGGFGSDHRLRSEILRIGALRGSRRLGRDPSECDTIVIGDTFHDVDAALAIGARAVCVATSGRSVDELEARGAHYAFESLEDPRVFEVLTQ